MGRPRLVFVLMALGTITLALPAGAASDKVNSRPSSVTVGVRLRISVEAASSRATNMRRRHWTSLAGTSIPRHP